MTCIRPALFLATVPKLFGFAPSLGSEAEEETDTMYCPFWSPPETSTDVALNATLSASDKPQRDSESSYTSAAPFAAAINTKSHEIYEWSVSYISDTGIEKVETFVTSSTVPVADRYYTFCRH